jgi:hypothetical protein
MLRNPPLKNFQESLKVEKNMMSLKGNPGSEPSKDKGKNKETMSKPSEEKKNYDSMDMEALQRIVKKLSNELIDLKKSGGEGSSSQKKFFRFPPKKDKNTPPTNKTNPSQERWY